MLILAMVLTALNPGDWMVALDLQGTYFHIPVLQALRRLLWFTVDQEHFQLAVFPFGILAPFGVHESDDGGCSSSAQVRVSSLPPTSMTGC